MKATCNGWTLEGTPSEIWQFIQSMEGSRKQQSSTIPYNPYQWKQTWPNNPLTNPWNTMTSGITTNGATVTSNGVIFNNGVARVVEGTE